MPNGVKGVPPGLLAEPLQQPKGKMSPVPLRADSVDMGAMPSLMESPAFILQAVDVRGVSQSVKKPDQSEKNFIADVDSDNPKKIEVFIPQKYGKDDMRHEMTHVFQSTRNPNITPYADTKGSGKDSYDYGGQKGLEKARLAGKTIANFNAEQQADIVKDYARQHDAYLAKAKAGKITKADEEAMYQLQQTYHPFIKQLASMPGVNENLKQHALAMLLRIQSAPVINMRPDAPGLPDYSVPGLSVLPADPLIGGFSQPTAKRK
jgi:hypothetical protein